jgi:hypothetical protein
MFRLTDEQLQILEEEQRLHLKGEGKSYTKEQACQIIRGEVDYNLQPISPPPTSAKKA